MLNLNPTTLAAVVDKARTDAAEHPRWLALIDRAVVELVQNPGSSAGIARRDYRQPGGNLYSANGTCQWQPTPTATPAGTAPPLGWCACPDEYAPAPALRCAPPMPNTPTPWLKWMSCSPNQPVAGALATLARPGDKHCGRTYSSLDARNGLHPRACLTNRCSHAPNRNEGRDRYSPGGGHYAPGVASAGVKPSTWPAQTVD